MSLGTRIREVRKSLPGKVTQADFGRELGVAREVITSYEIDKVTPSDPFIKLICRTYNVSYAWLKDGIGPMVLPPDTDDELVDEVMSGSNEFAKSVMRAFARAGKKNPAIWDVLKQLTDELEEIKKSGR
jgi:transcriptional regulator with XRE-family HTH domain